MASRETNTFLDIIKHLYVYIFSGVGMVFIIMGMYKGGEYLYKSFVLDTYRLESYREERCLNYGMVAYETPEKSRPTKEENEKSKKECLENLAKERVYERKLDIFKTGIFFIIGAFLFGIHFGWMRKKIL